MAGPTSSVELDFDVDDATLDVIDAFVKRSLAKVRESRKGRRWTGYCAGRPVTVRVGDRDDAPGSAVWFSAGSNSAADYDDLRKFSRELAELLGGCATEPTK